MDENLIPSSSTGELKEKGLITCVINRLQTSTDLKGFNMVTAVRWFAEQEHSAALAQLGSHISAIMRFGTGADDDPFVLIMDFSRLQEEALSEAYCDEETLKDTEKEDLEADTAKHSSTLETAVSKGHPDEICDQTSDVVIDACLTCDAKYKVACETCVKDNTVMVEREITVTEKHEDETLAVSFASEIIEMPVIQTQEKTRQVANTHVQHVFNTVETEFIDKTIKIPVVAQRQTPIDQTVQQTVETPQLQCFDEMIDVPVVSVVQVPHSLRSLRKPLRPRRFRARTCRFHRCMS